MEDSTEPLSAGLGEAESLVLAGGCCRERGRAGRSCRARRCCRHPGRQRRGAAASVAPAIGETPALLWTAAIESPDGGTASVEVPDAAWSPSLPDVVALCLCEHWRCDMGCEPEDLEARPDRVIILDADDPMREIHRRFVWQEEHDRVVEEVFSRAFAKGYALGVSEAPEVALLLRRRLAVRRRLTMLSLALSVVVALVSFRLILRTTPR